MTEQMENIKINFLETVFRNYPVLVFTTSSVLETQKTTYGDDSHILYHLVIHNILSNFIFFLKSQTCMWMKYTKVVPQSH